MKTVEPGGSLQAWISEQSIGGDGNPGTQRVHISVAISLRRSTH